MISSFDIPTTLSVYLVVNLCFTACLLFLRVHRLWNGALYWIGGNVITLGILVLLAVLVNSSRSAVPSSISLIPSTLLLLAQLLKLMALLPKPQRRSAMILGGSALILPPALVWTFGSTTDVRLGFVATLAILAALVGMESFVCYTQARWRRLRGSTLFIAANIALLSYLVFIGVSGVEVQQFGPMVEGLEQTRNSLLMSLVAFIITHISLVAMLMARLNRIVSASQIREGRQFRLARQAEIHAREMSQQAREKQSLLDVLIHEVRQPLNNAQAALQDVLMTLDVDSQDREAGRRLQAIIDRVVLSLSNAIAGASVLERRSQSLLVYVDVVSICQLACSDAGPDWEKHVDFVCSEDTLFADADPVLLRLAVRNLVDNAIKHSPRGEKVRIRVSADEDGTGVAIRVTNSPVRPFVPSPELFGRGVRGDDATPAGKGLGLYIVSEIALLHRGKLQAKVNEDGLTEFALLFPKRLSLPPM